MVDNVIAKTNQGYKNSQIPVRVKLHCLEQTKQSEAQGMKTLPDFAFSKRDGSKLRGSAVVVAFEHSRVLAIFFLARFSLQTTYVQCAQCILSKHG